MHVVDDVLEIIHRVCFPGKTPQILNHCYYLVEVDAVAYVVKLTPVTTQPFSWRTTVIRLRLVLVHMSCQVLLHC